MPSFSFSEPLLALDASSTAGSVGVWRDGYLVADDTVVMGAGQDDRLFPAIQRVLQQAQLEPGALRTIVCGSGPGSFTSLRIAAALAKGLAHGSGAALYAVPSLLIAAASLDSRSVPSVDFVVHADALRGERYVLPVHTEAQGMVVPAGPLARMAADALASSVPAAQRIGVLASPWADEPSPITPHIRHLARAAGSWREDAVSLATWEPEYGRLAEAQVKWEERHGMALPDTPALRA